MTEDVPDLPDDMELVRGISDLARFDGAYAYLLRIDEPIEFALVTSSGVVIPLDEAEAYEPGLGEVSIGADGVYVTPVNLSEMAPDAKQGLYEWIRKISGPALPNVRERVREALRIQASLEAEYTTPKED